MNHTSRKRDSIWTLIALSIALPVTLYAIWQSTFWIGQPFPGFFVMSNRVVSSVSGYSWPPNRPEMVHSRVLAANGVPISSNTQLYEYVRARPPGSPVTYTLRRNNREFKKKIAIRAFSITDYIQTCGILLLFGVLSFTLAAVVGFLQPHTTQARVYLFSGLVASLYPITGTLLYLPGSPLGPVYMVAESLFPATWIHLALVFPVSRQLSRAGRVTLVVAYALSATLAAFWIRGFYSEPPDFRALYIHHAYLALAICFFPASMIFAYWEDREPMARPRVKATLIGLVISTIPPLIVFLQNTSPTGQTPLQFGLVLSPIFYASVAYSIGNYDLFNIDRLVRRSFVYGALTVTVLGGYAGLLWLATNFAPGYQTRLSVAFVILVALGLEPLRRGVQRIVDRAYYRDELDYRSTIRDLSERLVTLLDLTEVVDHVTEVLAQAMRLESASIAIAGPGDSEATIWTRSGDGTLNNRITPSPVTHLARAIADTSERAIDLQHPRHQGQPSIHDMVPPALRDIDARLVLSLLSGAEPVGVLALGAKRSGKAFSSEDVDLLQTLANQIAIAIQNARSYTALQELTQKLDDKVSQRTEELSTSNDKLQGAYDELKNTQAQLVQSEKLASLGELVAGVAHELNNPASFVHGAIANLEDYMHRLTRVLDEYEQAAKDTPNLGPLFEEIKDKMRLDFVLKEMPRLVQISSVGTDRIKQIVDDLRLFARADRGERTIVGVADGLDNTISLLGHRLQAGVIEIEKTYANCEEVLANPGQLNQVWMNLLTNAIDALQSTPNPRIAVIVTRGADETLRVEIRDNGCGIDTDTMPRVFEPFFTTKPIGKGTGLGLSIAYGAVKSQGGTIHIESDPATGTRITVSLPLAATSETRSRLSAGP